MRTGQRSDVLFDSADLDILETLRQHHKTTEYEEDGNTRYAVGMPVLELVENLKMTHKSLKPHINKLIALEFIIAYNANGQVYLTTNAAFDRLMGADYSHLSESEQEKEYALIKLEDDLVKALKAVKNYYYKSGIQKRIETDLRKRTRIKNLSEKPLLPKSFFKEINNKK